MGNDPFESCLKELYALYRKTKHEVNRSESQYLQKRPSKLLEHEVIMGHGMLKGILQAISLVELKTLDNELPFEESLNFKGKP